MNTGRTGTLGRAGEMADTLLEGLQRLRVAARSFRKDHQDLAAVELLLGEKQRVAAFLAAGPLDRDDADDVVGEPAAQFARIEIIHRPHRPELRQEPPRHQRHHRQRIEIRVVVAGEHGGAVLRQPLAMAHCQPKRNEDHRAHHQREEQEPEQPRERVLAHG
jgi:hypothetical protein